jgi:hypothetical protein
MSLNHRAVLVFALALVAAIALGMSRRDWDFKSSAARSAMAKYKRAVVDAEDELVANLEEAMKAATRAANLDEANRLKVAISELRGERNADAGEPVEALTGVWRIYFDNAHTHVLEVRGDGQAVLAEIDGHRRDIPGRVRTNQNTGDVLLRLHSGPIERLTLARGRLVVEHYPKPDDFPEGEPVLGIGRRVAGTQ